MKLNSLTYIKYWRDRNNFVYGFGNNIHRIRLYITEETNKQATISYPKKCIVHIQKQKKNIFNFII